MAVQQPILGSTTIAGLLGIVGNNATQQLADEAALTALQQQVTNILSRASSAPGSYNPPGAAGAQSYSAKSTPWTSAVSQGNMFMSVATAANTIVGYVYTDVWDAANLVDIAFSYSSTSALLTAFRIQRNAGKAPTVLGYVSMASSNPIAAVTIVSPKLARVTSLVGTGATSEALVSWSGTALTVTTATTSVVNLPSAIAQASTVRRGFLVGSASLVAFGSSYTSGLLAGTLRDRNATNVAQVALASTSTIGASVSTVPVAGYGAADVVGSGYHLRAGSSYNPADPTIRPALFLEYYDDFGSTRVATLRVTNTNFGGWTSLVMVSPTLAIGQYADATLANTYYTVAISVNVGNASPLGLYGPFVSGAMGSGRLVFPLLYDGTDAYFFDTTTLTTSAPFTIKLRRLIFNPANTGSELTTSTANDITVTLGATSAGTGGSGNALTSLTFYGAFQVQDQLQVIYFGGTGTAGTTGVYVETFNLS